MFSSHQFSSLIWLNIVLALLISFGCNTPVKKKDQNYHSSASGLDILKNSGDSVVNIAKPDSVAAFLKGKTFRYKTSQLVFDDSLVITVSHNGKIDFTAQCQVDDYLINNERLISILDSSNSENTSYTISYQGFITDKNTYALFKLDE